VAQNWLTLWFSPISTAFARFPPKVQNVENVEPPWMALSAIPPPNSAALGPHPSYVSNLSNPPFSPLYWCFPPKNPLFPNTLSAEPALFNFPHPTQVKNSPLFLLDPEDLPSLLTDCDLVPLGVSPGILPNLCKNFFSEAPPLCLSLMYFSSVNFFSDGWEDLD